jgi:7-cyano-7-deazaguanine synthase
MINEGVFMSDIFYPSVDKVALSLSGGLDSTTLLYMLANRYGKENVYAISFYYQQKQSIELDLAKASCESLGVNHKVVDISFLGDIARKVSTNIGGSTIEMPTIVDILGNPQPVTYVPFRNLLFSSMLLSFAEANDCGAIALGLNSNDQYNYWDTTPEFVQRLSDIVELNRMNSIEIFTPLVSMNKTEEILVGLENGCDYSKTITCYDPVDGKSCGICPSCAERIRAFKNVGKQDPISYMIDINWD